MSASAETVKVDSNYLAGTIGDQLHDPSPAVDHDAELLLKFHGVYQQDDRDVRRERTSRKQPLAHSCMVRASVPGGTISPDQWLALDRMASLAGDRLRLTTRQGVQYHLVQKSELRELVGSINRTLLTTLGACGDVVRNVMACPLPHPERRAILDPVVADLVARFRPQTESYWELWVDGDRAVSAIRPERPADGPSIDEVEPLYGAAYLPRKFKIGIAWPGDHCVDVHTHDVGIVPTLTDGTSGELTGFVVLAGGGMGMSHQRPDDTYPVLARSIGWVPPGDLGRVVEAIVAAQRDHGDREDRSRARLKYTLETRGVDWLRDQIEARTGLALAPPVPLLDATVDAHHGWHEVTDPDGGVSYTLGLPVASGTVAGGLRWALRRLAADGVVSELRVTPRQDLLLVGVSSGQVETVENLLRANGVRLAADQSPTRNLAIACPALPTCSKALGEAERVLPEVVDRIEKVLADTGTTGLPLRLNMTGCPNGCSRPYAAELGIVGRTKREYDVFVGGSAAGDRLARRLRAGVPLTDVPDLLRPLLERFGRDTDGATSFGDWADAHFDDLEPLLPAPTGATGASPDATVGSSSVALVGAGPGDPELLTRRAERLLRDADVVVHDALVGAGVLELVPPRVERIDVGKRAGRPVAQEMISALLVELARQGRRVVRLKGGDPFVFGRGGEEAVALHAAGIDVEVVPGVTSSIAAPAAAGIPVTHRGVAASVTVVTGHRRDGESAPDWASFARVVDGGGTLVVLMGVANRGAIAEALIAGGAPADTPVAAISAATTDDEHVARCELGRLASTPVASPATIVVGAVAALDVTGDHPASAGRLLALAGEPSG